jgi:hypothetical protein
MGSFTLDVYGGQPEWGRNLEAAQLVGVELEKAVDDCEARKRSTGSHYNGLSPFKEKGSGASIS